MLYETACNSNSVWAGLRNLKTSFRCNQSRLPARFESYLSLAPGIATVSVLPIKFTLPSSNSRPYPCACHLPPDTMSPLSCLQAQPRLGPPTASADLLVEDCQQVCFPKYHIRLTIGTFANQRGREASELRSDITVLCGRGLVNGP